MKISSFLGAGSDGLRVPVVGLTRVDRIQGKKDRDNIQMAFGQAYLVDCLRSELRG